MPLCESQESRNDRLRARAVGVLSERLFTHATDEMARTLVEAWVAGGSAVASTCIEAPGPLKSAWGKGDQTTLVELMLEFTFPMMCRWFRYVRGAVDGLPADRLKMRKAWTRYVLTIFWRTGLERRLAIRTRFDSLFNIECEANTKVGVSPSALGLVPPNSLSPTEAADLTQSGLRDFRTVDESSRDLAMAVMKGRASISEPLVLGMRALGLCGRLQRFNRHWDEITFTPVRPSADLVRAIPWRVWSLSSALLLVTQLEVGMATMFRRLKPTFPR